MMNVILQTTEEDKLSKPYHRSTDSKFTKQIANFKFPPKTKMPSNVKMYDGSQDPDDHLSIFSEAAEVEQSCHMFIQTLVGPARL